MSEPAVRPGVAVIKPHDVDTVVSPAARPALLPARKVSCTTVRSAGLAR
jgi:hypothetical protein